MNFKNMEPTFLIEAIKAAHRARQQLLDLARETGRTSDVEVLGAFREFDAYFRGVVPAPIELVNIIESRLAAAIKLAARGIVSSQVKYRSPRKLLTAEASKIVRETLENLLPYDPKKLSDYYEQFPGVFVEDQLSGRLTESLREAIREAYYRAHELQLKDEVERILSSQWIGFAIEDVFEAVLRLNIHPAKAHELRSLLQQGTSEQLKAAVRHLLTWHDELADASDKMLTAGRQISELADYLTFVATGVLPGLRRL